jgi:hypothetical protein
MSVSRSSGPDGFGNVDAENSEVDVPATQPSGLAFSRSASPASPLDLGALPELTFLSDEPLFCPDALQRAPSGPCPPMPMPFPVVHPEPDLRQSAGLPPSPRRRDSAESVVPAAQVTPDTPSGVLGSQLSNLQLQPFASLRAFLVGMGPMLPGVASGEFLVPLTPKPDWRGIQQPTGLRAPPHVRSDADLPRVVGNKTKRQSPTILNSINPEVGRVLEFLPADGGASRVASPVDLAWNIDAARRTASFRGQLRRGDTSLDVGAGILDDEEEFSL